MSMTIMIRATYYEYDDNDPRTPEQRASYEAADAQLDAAWTALSDKCEAEAKKFAPKNAEYMALLNQVNVIYGVSQTTSTEEEIKVWLDILAKAMKEPMP